MSRIVLAAAFIALTIAPAVHARKAPRIAWQVMRATDPITKASTCAVVASDYVGKTRFTQSGGLYPVVEMNSTYGLLVGVSSGGQYRFPTGDILWVVDDLPYRELLAADNPGAVSLPTSAMPAATIEAMTAYSMQLTRSLNAISTMASGAKAREMLDELLNGRSLLFRSKVGPQTGLPNYSALFAGQVNEKRHVRPVPLDASFRDGLKACGMVSSRG